MIQTTVGHTDVHQRKRATEARGQIVYTLGGILDAKRFGCDTHCFRGGFTIECDRMRQYDCVCLRMWQIERAAQRVTELVMDRHAQASKNRPGKPGAV